MRKRYWGILMISIILVGCMLGLGLYHGIKRPFYTNQWFELMNENDRKTFSQEELQTYKHEISDEISKAKTRNHLKWSYYALASIEQQQGNFLDSNHYLNRILSISSFLDSTLEDLVYQDLAINYLALNEFETSYSYFKKAEQLVERYKKDDLKADLYNRYGHAILAHTDKVGIAVSLFEHCLSLNINHKQKMESLLFLANSYLSAGLYDRAISYLVNAFELSTYEEHKAYSQGILIDLAVAYYLNEDYESTINSLEVLQSQEAKVRSNWYLLLLADSYCQVYGQEKADQYLRNYIDNIDLSYIEDEEELNYWLTIFEAQYRLYEGKIEEADQLIQQLSSLNMDDGSVLLKYLELWYRKIVLDLKVEKNDVEQEALINEYGELYDEVKSLKYSPTKMLLLKIIVQQSLLLGNYELGYDYLHSQDKLLAGNQPNLEPNSIYHIYENVTEEVAQIQKVKNRIQAFFAIFLLIVGGTIGCLGYYLQQKYRYLQRVAVGNKDIQSLTETLTKEALYECLEYYTQSRELLTFMMVDIDDFTRYNELYGYLQGDNVLNQLSQLIKEVFPSGYISCHQGQCFIIVMLGEDCDFTSNLRLLYKKMEELNIAYATNLEHGRITISGGVARGIITSKNDIDKYISAASHKVQISKKRGKNTFTL